MVVSVVSPGLEGSSTGECPGSTGGLGVRARTDKVSGNSRHRFVLCSIATSAATAPGIEACGPRSGPGGVPTAPLYYPMTWHRRTSVGRNVVRSGRRVRAFSTSFLRWWRRTRRVWTTGSTFNLTIAGNPLTIPFWCGRPLPFSSNPPPVPGSTDLWGERRVEVTLYTTDVVCVYVVGSLFESFGDWRTGNGGERTLSRPSVVMSLL